MQSKEFVRTAMLQMTVADVDTAAASVIADTAGLDGQVQQDDRSGTGSARSAALVVVLPGLAVACLIGIPALLIRRWRIRAGSPRPMQSSAEATP